jgi:hypothetical protein
MARSMDHFPFDHGTPFGGFRSSLEPMALFVADLPCANAGVWTLLDAGDRALIDLLHFVLAALRLLALASCPALFGALLLSMGCPRTLGTHTRRTALMQIFFGTGSLILFIVVGAGG